MTIYETLKAIINKGLKTAEEIIDMADIFLLNKRISQDEYNELQILVSNTMSLDDLKRTKIKNNNATYQQIIYSGVDVKTSKGTEHFSLTLEDQANLKSAYDIVKQTNLAVPYHSDENGCRVFQPEEIIGIYITSQSHITLNTSLCNMINTWIRRCQTIEEVNGIKYNSELPVDLKELLNANLAQAQNVIDVLKGN